MLISPFKNNNELFKNVNCNPDFDRPFYLQDSYPIRLTVIEELV